MSFRFPFPTLNASLRNLSSATAVALSVAVSAAAAGAGIAAMNRKWDILQSSPIYMAQGASLRMWGSVSLSGNSSPVTESRTGTAFPAVVNDSQLLLGVGVRRKAILGLKNIDVYAFGVYADAEDLEENLQLKKDLIDSNIRMTVRLQIVYSRLSIKSVRSAFEGSVGNRIRKFSGSDTEGDKELLQRFVSQFRDEYKIPKGSIIDLSRDKDYVLRTSIDGVEVGSIESKLLCKSILDLYIGDEPVDRKAKEEVENGVSSLLRK